MKPQTTRADCRFEMQLFDMATHVNNKSTAQESTPQAVVSLV